MRILKENQPYLRESYGVSRIGLFGSFAKGNAKPYSDVDIVIEFERPVGRSRLKISGLVEYVVGRQQGFGAFLQHFAFGDKRNGVQYLLAFSGRIQVHETHRQRGFQPQRCKALKGGEVLHDEIFFFKQVQRRIAGKRQFREYDNVGAQTFGFSGEGRYLYGVGGDIAYFWIYLGYGYFHNVRLSLIKVSIENIGTDVKSAYNGDMHPG